MTDNNPFDSTPEQPQTSQQYQTSQTSVVTQRLVPMAIITLLVALGYFGYKIYSAVASFQERNDSLTPILVVDPLGLVTRSSEELGVSTDDTSQVLRLMIKRFDEAGYVVLHRNAVLSESVDDSISLEEFLEFYKANAPKPDKKKKAKTKKED